MERFNFRRMGLAAIIGTIAMAKQGENKFLEKVALGFYRGGYSNQAHGWAGKRGKFKSNGITPRRSKAQRRARSAN